MASRHVFAVLVVALAGCGSSQSASQAKTDSPGATPCGPASARTLVGDSQARVYQQGKSVLGCAVGGTRSYRLGTSAFCNNADRVGPVALGGVIAAYGVQRCGIDTGTAQVVVRRLSDGKALHTFSAVSRVPGAESYAAVGSIVVKRDGSTGWIGEAHSIIRRGSPVVEVHRFDAHGQALLDQGPGIPAASLRLKASRLTWLHSGSPRSAPLS